MQVLCRLVGYFSLNMWLSAMLYLPAARPWHGGRNRNRRLAPRAIIWLARKVGRHEHLGRDAISLASANGRTANSYHAHRTSMPKGAQMLARHFCTRFGIEARGG